jgi:hypothetical protein
MVDNRLDTAEVRARAHLRFKPHRSIEDVAFQFAVAHALNPAEQRELYQRLVLGSIREAGL